MPRRFHPKLWHYRWLGYWLVVNVIGWWLAWGFLFVVGDLLFESDSHWPEVFIFPAYFVAGGILGLVQFQALKDRFGLSAIKWIAASATGFGLAMAAMSWANLLDLYIRSSILAHLAYEWDPFIGAIILAFFMGCCQAVVWRRCRYQTLSWLVYASLGWFLGLFLVEIGNYHLFDSQSGYGSLLLFLMVVPVVVGLLTGFALNRIPIRPGTA